MRIGLLADLHANREAFEACLTALTHAGCRRVVVLGDLVGYGADPAWVVDRVRELVDAGGLAVLGNHDAAVDDPAASRLHPDAQRVLDWTRRQLDERQRDFLRGLPLQVAEADRLYVHANAWHPAGWAYIFGAPAALRSLAATTQRLTFCGHVHVPALYYAGLPADIATHFPPRPGTPVPLLPSRRWLAVVGTCGQPRDGDPAAACAWFDPATRQLGFLRVPYDHAAAAARIRAAGLPEVFAARLLEGA